VRLPEERSTLLVEAYGPQAVDVRFATAGGPGDNAYVLVRTPNTLVYCLDAHAVTACAYSWLIARERAARALRADVAPPGAHRGARVVGSITLQGPQRLPDARLYSAPDSPNGAAHVVVRLDGLTVRAYDRASLDSHARGWADAVTAAYEAFERPPRQGLAALIQKARDHVRGPYSVEIEQDLARTPPGANRTWLASRSSEVRSL
jgi:hypothetical protein